MREPLSSNPTLKLFDKLHSSFHSIFNDDNDNNNYDDDDFVDHPIRNGAADIVSGFSPQFYDRKKGDYNDLSYHDLQLSTFNHLPKSSPSTNISFPSTPSSYASSQYSYPKNKPKSCRLLKTGTTIVGCLANNHQAVILAADTRATSNTIVADKRCEKVHQLAPNVWFCGAGTSGDIDALVRQVKYTFLLRNRIDGTIGNILHDSFSSDTDIANVYAICKFIRSQLFPAKGVIGANLVLGGYDYTQQKAVLAAIHPHGSIDTTIPFTALGSGGLAAMSVLEANYLDQSMTIEEAQHLCIQAVKAGIDNDLGSGSQVDICIITQKGVHYQRAILEEESLILLDRDVISEKRLQERHLQEDSDTFLGGVNGFGSLPYRARSKRVVVENEAHIEKDRENWIRGKLGLLEEDS